MKAKVGIFICALTFCIAGASSSAEYGPELSSLLEAIRLGDSMVKSGMGHYTIRDKGGFDMEIFFAFEGKKVHFDALKTNAPYAGITTEVWDGEKRLFLMRGKEGKGPYHASISSDEPHLGDHDIRTWGMTFLGSPLFEMFTSGVRAGWGRYSRIDSIKLEGREVIDGDECYVLSFIKTPEGRKPYKCILWINPQKGYRVSKMEINYDENRRTVVSVRFREYPGGVWFPKSVRRRLLDLGYLVTIDVSDDFQVNIDVPDELFQPRFPPGTSVRDERTRRLFRSGR